MKLPYVINIFVCLVLSGCLRQVLLYLLAELNVKGSLFNVSVSGMVVTFKTISRMVMFRISSISEVLNNLELKYDSVKHCTLILELKIHMVS